MNWPPTITKLSGYVANSTDDNLIAKATADLTSDLTLTNPDVQPTLWSPGGPIYNYAGSPLPMLKLWPSNPSNVGAAKLYPANLGFNSSSDIDTMVALCLPRAVLVCVGTRAVARLAI